MRRIFEWIGGFALIAFSFYFTDRVSLLVANKSDLMQEIKAVSKDYEEEPIDAVINVTDNSIIPGKFGRSVNSQESYLEMHDFGKFNENYLIYDYIKPKKSLEDNKDKYILSGNPKNRYISLILMPNEQLEKYLTGANILFNLVTSDSKEMTENIEIINGTKTKEEFNTMNSKLDNDKKLCLKGESMEPLCKKNDYYLLDPKLTLNNTNLIEIKNSLAPGSIILISSSVKLENLKLILNEIEFKDLEIVHISKLIKRKFLNTFFFF